MTEDQKPMDDKPISASEIRDYFFNLFREFLDLDKGVDKWGTIHEIKSKQSMSGANAWMLMCSILIASIGLNLDSQAVIIGAMLISPLMSPILGIGLGVAINDKDALSHALLHFGAAILIALIFSTLYFWLIPLDQFTEQIEARTKPTFLDVLIGVFGGVAGIVSLARKDISTTLPGVAIATALMPPLCVTGYGLANANWEVASTSFYLFFLNSFFVAFSTYLVLRYLKFPHKEYSSKADRRRNLIRVGLFSLLMIIPSFLIFRNVLLEYQQEDRIRRFMDSYIGEDEIFLDSYTIKTENNGNQKLYLKVYGEKINEAKIPDYEFALDSLGVKNMEVEIIPTSEIPLDKIKQLESGLDEVGTQLNSQIEQLKEERIATQRLIDAIDRDPSLLLSDSTNFKNAVDKIRIFLPEIEEVGIADVKYGDNEGVSSHLPTALVKWSRPKTGEKEKLEDYIKTYFQLDTLKLVIYSN